MANKILNLKHSKRLNILSIAAPYIMNKNKAIGKYIQYALQIESISSIIIKVATITESFSKDFIVNLNKLQLPKTNDLIMNNVPNEIDKKEIISKLEKVKVLKDGLLNDEAIVDENNIQEEHHYLPKEIIHKRKSTNQSRLSQMDLGGEHDVLIKENIKTLHSLTNAEHKTEINMLQKKVSNMVTMQIMAAIQGGIIKPISNMLISKAVQCISEKIQKDLNGAKTVMEDVIDLQRKERLKGRRHGYMEKQSPEDKKKYKAMLDIVVNETKDSKGNILHLMAILDELEAKGKKIQIVIFENGKHSDTIGNGDGTKQIVLDLTNDHWSLMNENGERQDAQRTGIKKDNCLFDSLAHYFNKSADELRDLIGKRLANNADHYINLMPDYEALKQNQDKFGGIWEGGAKVKSLRRGIQYVNIK
jgi:hypothetical protein